LNICLFSDRTFHREDHEDHEDLIRTSFSSRPSWLKSGSCKSCQPAEASKAGQKVLFWVRPNPVYRGKSRFIAVNRRGDTPGLSRAVNEDKINMLPTTLEFLARTYNLVI
jgi:hypothetical protein